MEFNSDTYFPSIVYNVIELLITDYCLMFRFIHDIGVQILIMTNNYLLQICTLSIFKRFTIFYFLYDRPSQQHVTRVGYIPMAIIVNKHGGSYSHLVKEHRNTGVPDTSVNFFFFLLSCR